MSRRTARLMTLWLAALACAAVPAPLWAAAPATREAWRIAEGERVSVTVQGIFGPYKLMHLTRRIGPSGAFPLPFVENLNLGGLTAEGARLKVVAAYDAAFLIRAEVAMVVVVLPDRGESFSAEPGPGIPSTRPAPDGNKP